MGIKQNLTRYENVKAILDKADGGSTTTYGPYGERGKFWELSLAELLTVEIAGLSLIDAPPSTKTSCCAGKTGATDNKSTRGERSGLIVGLKGEYPFDGSQYERLPWGGDAVDKEDIAFIQDWIDDDCPAADTLQTNPLERQAVLDTGDSVDQRIVMKPSYTLPVSEPDIEQASGKRMRFNIDCMTAKQLQQYRDAMRALYDFNQYPNDWRNYNNLALSHQNHCQHAWERFLPWHRVYLYEFEQAMREVSGLNVAIPYWDFVMPQYTADGDPTKGDIIPLSYKAFLTGESIEQLRATDLFSGKQLSALAPVVFDPQCDDMRCNRDKLFGSQKAFMQRVEELWDGESAKPYRTAFLDVLLKSNSLWYTLRYPAEYIGKDGKPITIEQSVGYHYPQAGDIDQIQSLKTFRDYGGGSAYDDSFGFLDQNPHNTMHIWTGGNNPEWDKNNTPKGVQVNGRNYHKSLDLYSQPQYGDMFSNLTASFDPIFWPIHSNIDRLWSEWQDEHPSAAPRDLSSVLSPWSYTVDDTLDHARFGYEYVRSCYYFPADMGVLFRQLTTSPVRISNGVLTDSCRVEVRLKQVPQLPVSFYIRIFINLPYANQDTPLESEHYGGFVAIFGHGECYGGPGHCDVPSNANSASWQRERHHNEPRNHRINVSTAFQRLKGKVGDEYSVTLVVVGHDGQSENLLRLGGISLNVLE